VKARVGFGKSIPINFEMLLSMPEEQQIYNLVNNKATGLSKEPPTLKYEYKKVGA